MFSLFVFVRRIVAAVAGLKKQRAVMFTGKVVLIATVIRIGVGGDSSADLKHNDVIGLGASCPDVRKSRTLRNHPSCYVLDTERICSKKNA